MRTNKEKKEKAEPCGTPDMQIDAASPVRSVSKSADNLPAQASSQFLDGVHISDDDTEIMFANADIRKRLACRSAGYTSQAAMAAKCLPIWLNHDEFF